MIGGKPKTHLLYFWCPSSLWKAVHAVETSSPAQRALEELLSEVAFGGKEWDEEVEKGWKRCSATAPKGGQGGEAEIVNEIFFSMLLSGSHAPSYIFGICGFAVLGAWKGARREKRRKSARKKGQFAPSNSSMKVTYTYISSPNHIFFLFYSSIHTFLQTQTQRSRNSLIPLLEFAFRISFSFVAQRPLRCSLEIDGEIVPEISK